MITLPAGKTYVMQIAAFNDASTGDWSSSVTANAGELPAAPVLRTPVPEPGIVALNWTAPTGASQAMVTGYRVRWAQSATPTTWLNSGGSDGAEVSGGAAARSYTVRFNIDSETDHTVQVAAVNSFGTGAWAMVTTATLAWPASATRLSALIPFSSKLVPDFDPVVTSYTITVGPDDELRGRADFFLSPTSQNPESRLAVDGITARQGQRSTPIELFQFDVPRVVEVVVGTQGCRNTRNCKDRRIYTVTITRISATPLAPSGVSAAPGDARVTLAWTAPDSRGAAITTYRYRWSNDGDDTDWESAGGADGVAIPNSASLTSHPVTGLSNGKLYVMQVAAVNSRGTGAWSESASASAGAPSAPQNFSIAPGKGALTLTWSAPASAGNTVISGYRYRWSNDGDDSAWDSAGGDDGVEIANSAAATTYTVPSLTNGTTYFTQIAAVNSSGTGEWTASVRSRPLDRPGQPVSLAAGVLNTGIVLSWQPPSARGGASIGELRYGVRWRVTTTASYAAADAATTAAGETDYQVSGLTNGTTYALQVRTINPAEESDWAEITATPVAFDLDLDGDGDADGIDGLLVARYLLGLRGSDLSAGLGLADSVFIAAIETDISGNLASLDVDNSGATNAADGILIARYLLGVTSGAPLYAGQAASTAELTIIMRISALVPAP
ncbi:MAG: fibronectin type III domain-containing protein [Gammaproteobacteria bacterium]